MRNRQWLVIMASFLPLAFKHFGFQDEAALRHDVPAFTPSRICTRPACSSPSFNALLKFVAIQGHKTICSSPSVCNALSGMSSTLSRMVVTISTSANMPGFKRPSALSDDADFDGSRT